MARLHGLLMVLLLTLLPGIARASESDARRLLEVAAEAARAVRAVEYEFVSGAPDHPVGWASGRARLRQVTDPSDSWIHVEGVIHAQPAFEVAEQRFEYAYDGEHAYQIDSTARTFQSEPAGAGGNTLSVSAIYGFVTELIEPRPFWKELEHATSLRLLPPESVAGVECDVVEISYRQGDGAADVTTWWLGRDDRLPRRGEWTRIDSPTPPFAMEFRNLSTGHDWQASDFVLAAPSGFEVVPVESRGVGRPLPQIALEDADGAIVRLHELGGDVLVLDFWNTWCYICRTQTPAIAEMAKRLDGEGVRFFGVNVFETGDPVAYWNAAGYPHPVLLDGDELAYALDLPYQPGIAVVDPSGKVVFTQLGGSPDRAERVRRAIASAMASAR